MVQPIACRLQTCTACYCTEYCRLYYSLLYLLYYIILYYIISYHIISYHIISYHIIPYHIILYYIILYYIILYYIILYYIILYCRMCVCMCVCVCVCKSHPLQFSLTHIDGHLSYARCGRQDYPYVTHKGTGKLELELHSLNLGARWRCVVNCIPRPLYNHLKNPSFLLLNR